MTDSVAMYARVYPEKLLKPNSIDLLWSTVICTHSLHWYTHWNLEFVKIVCAATTYLCIVCILCYSEPHSITFRSLHRTAENTSNQNWKFYSTIAEECYMQASHRRQNFIWSEECSCHCMRGTDVHFLSSCSHPHTLRISSRRLGDPPDFQGMQEGHRRKKKFCWMNRTCLLRVAGNS